MLNILNKIPTLLLVSFLTVGFLFTACKKDDDNGKSNKIELFSFGPSPALRGGELRFIGNNLDKVTAILLPDNVQVTTFTTKTSELIVITVPQEAVAGHVTLKTPEGDITSVSILTISEPIVLTSFSPAKVRPGETITLTGDYLNLIKTIIFNSNKMVGDTAFLSHSREKIELKLPAAAQTGFITLSNAAEPIPILIKSVTELEVTVPKANQLSPNPVKASTTLTIQGTDLDLTKEVAFEGGGRVSTFISQSATKIELAVPADAHDGKIKTVPASLVEIESATDLVMIVPSISSISPNPVKNGQNITVTGTDLDLVTKVTFGGGKAGAILGGGTPTQITVKVPISATEDVVTFGTAAEKSVASSGVLQLIKPTVTSINPPDAKAGDVITLSGNDLDLVTTVKFTGGVQAAVNNATLNQATVTVPIGATTGPLTLMLKNASEVTIALQLNILLATNAVITSMPSMAAPGDMISIIGENLNELNEVIFPGNVSATMFGQKTATLIEVFIPLNVQLGMGNIKFITFTGEEFFSPSINIQGVDPVDDPALVFFNFDGLNGWWGDAGAIENDPALTLDGSSYFRVNQACSGWTGFFWRNGGDNFPGATIGTDISGYVFKFDINVLEPITGGEFAWRLKGSDGDFWRYWKPWEATGSYQTNGWITITIPLSEFSDGGNPIPNLANIDSDFGVAFNNGDSFVNACIDNVRFEKL